MELFMTILMVAGAALILWWTYSTITKNPRAFSARNTSKSLTTLGILALILIAFIALLVKIVKSS